MSTREKRSPLRGRYLIQNPVWNAAFRAVDGALALGRRAPGTAPIPTPRRILLANSAHIGDVVIATSVIPLLRSAFPAAELGFLVASWARPAIAGHAEVRWVHTVDHWYHNRAPISRRVKLRKYAETRQTALREIRTVGYDVAIDLYSFFPNNVPLLWQAGVPVRIGYTSGGFGPLLTHPFEWVDSDRHAAEYHADLVGALGVTAYDIGSLASSLPPRSPAAEAGANRVLSSQGMRGEDYVVLHPGTGSPLREWPLERWQGLARRVAQLGYRVVLTGLGGRENETNEAIRRAEPSCVNLCDRLRWDEFVAVIAWARAVVCVESVCSHVAGATRTPSVVIMSGITNSHHWHPLGGQARVVANSVACAPCFQSRGCESMACVRGLREGAVFDAVLKTISPDGAAPPPVPDNRRAPLPIISSH